MPADRRHRFFRAPTVHHTCVLAILVAVFQVIMLRDDLVTGRYWELEDVQTKSDLVQKGEYGYTPATDGTGGINVLPLSYYFNSLTMSS